MSNKKTTFISKYRSYGITLPSGTRLKFQENILVTDDPAVIAELKTSPAYGKDYNTVPEVAVEETVKGTKK